MLRQAKERETSVVVKIWPCPRWRHVSLTFQLFKKHQSSPPKSMLYPTSSKSSLIWYSLRSKNFSSEPSNPSNRSPLISADSYTTLSSSTFITCNTPQGQLWINADFHACNPNEPASMITTVTTNRYVKIVWLRGSRPYPFASTPTAQSSINRPPSPTKRKIRILILILIGILILFPIYIHPLDSSNSYNLRIIVKLLFPIAFLD